MTCPYCGTDNDAHKPMSDAPKPYPGAASLCAYCCHFGIFTDDLEIRKPNEQEQRELNEDEAAQAVLRMAQAVQFAMSFRG